MPLGARKEAAASTFLAYRSDASASELLSECDNSCESKLTGFHPLNQVEGIAVGVVSTDEAGPLAGVLVDGRRRALVVVLGQDTRGLAP
jgi:hypothetical protein